MTKRIKIFSRLIFFSIIVTYLVILAGSIVRATGSGMGCPDWPKCFGQYIPPTDISQLPENYKEVFKVQGKEIADFNALHTWVEYINRLLGVVMGFLVLGVLIFSFLVRKEFSKMYIFSIVVFLATLFQAWLGAKVVSSNLAPVKITVHMVFALIILAALIYQYHSVNSTTHKEKLKTNTLKKATFLLLFLCIVQILLGTQVRQQIDEIALQFGNSFRDKWILNLNWIFDVHKTLAAILIGLCFYVYYESKKIQEKNTKYSILPNLLLITVVAEFFVGLILNYAYIPAFFQPVHLIFSCVIFGIVFKIYLEQLFSLSNMN